MAIVVEEQKNKAGLASILIWVVILVIIMVAIYYIFFAKPQLIGISAPDSFRNINPLSHLNINPQDIVNNPTFQSLKQYVMPASTSTVGRSNPFLSF